MTADAFPFPSRTPIKKIRATELILRLRYALDGSAFILRLSQRYLKGLNLLYGKKFRNSVTFRCLSILLILLIPSKVS